MLPQKEEVVLFWYLSANAGRELALQEQKSCLIAFVRIGEASARTPHRASRCDPKQQDHTSDRNRDLN
jgi:hypothetical protein